MSPRTAKSSYRTDPPELDSFVEQLKAVNGDFAKLSLEMGGLVDELINRPLLNQKLIEQFGSDGENSFNQISYYDYQPTLFNTDLPSPNQIAVVVASGAIVDGNQRQGTVGGDSTAALLREARLNDEVKAVILRVDSPGGSAFASEVIRSEVDALKLAGKPVVVSMSSLAASGGYWISSSADKILAQPTTITGSIGIFAILTTFEKGLENMGVYSDGVGTTPFSGVGVTRELPEALPKSSNLASNMAISALLALLANTVICHSHRLTRLPRDAYGQARTPCN